MIAQTDFNSLRSTDIETFRAQILPLTREALVVLLATLDTEIAFIRAKIQDVGSWAEPGWLRRAEHAARVRGRQKAWVQVRLTEIKGERRALTVALPAEQAEKRRKRLAAVAEIKQATARTFAEVFVDLARDLLPAATFEELKEETKRRCAAGAPASLPLSELAPACGAEPTP